MADTSTALTSLSSFSNTYKAQLDALVAQYKLTQNKPIDDLNTKKTKLTTQTQTYSAIKTKLGVLRDTAVSFSATDSTSKWTTTEVSSSNSNILSATSSSNTAAGNYSVFVSKLAKADKILSSKINKDDSNYFNEGSYSFSIKIGDQEYQVKTDIAKEEKNSSILGDIVTAINGSDAGTKVNASLITDSKNQQRLLISSRQTGSSNALTLSDTSGDLLSKLGFLSKDQESNSRIKTKGSDGGYLYSSVDDLDANFTIDGIEMIRGTNTISDAIDGITINLKGVQNPDDQEIQLTVNADETGAKTNIDAFIKNYNDTIQLLNQKLNTVNEVRGELAGDSVLTNLRFNMRSIVNSRVSTVKSGNPSNLTDIGVITNSDGTLTLKDVSKLNSALNKGPDRITDLFNTSKGIAVRLKDLLKPYTDSNSLLDKRGQLNTGQIKSIDQRIKLTQAQIDAKAEALRTKYENLLNTIDQLKQQQATLNSILSYSSSSSSTSLY